jgi:hypothetical protein
MDMVTLTVTKVLSKGPSRIAWEDGVTRETRHTFRLVDDLADALLAQELRHRLLALKIQVGVMIAQVNLEVTGLVAIEDVVATLARKSHQILRVLDTLEEQIKGVIRRRRFSMSRHTYLRERISPVREI